MVTVTKRQIADLNIKETKNNRNYGIDLYKIFAMYMVVVVHILNAGGVFKNCEQPSLNSFVASIVLIFVYSAVNCFALASGYIMINVKYKFSRIINYWLQVVFYCLAIAIIFCFISQFAGVKDIVKAFLPVTFNQYWYFTAYFILLLFIPFLNYVMNGISKKKYQVLVLLLIGIFSIEQMLRFGIINVIKTYDYSFYWLAILYIIGGYFGKYGNSIKIKSIFLWLVIISCILITEITVFSDLLIESQNKVLYLLGKLGKRFNLLSYTSPTILSISLSLLILFHKIELKNKFIINLVKFVSPLAFSVYLIHTNKLIYIHILMNSCSKLAEMNTAVMVLGVLGIAIAIFMVCIFIDYFRLLMFKKLKINKRTEQLCNFVSRRYLNRK